jgi:lipoprotein-releasing system permease protein
VPRSFELFVALRYLRAKRSEKAISFITGIAVAGVAAGVMALVIALSVNNGFRHTLERSLLGATPHVIVLEKEPEAGIANWRDLGTKLAKLQHVRSVSPSLYGQVFVSTPVRAAGAFLKGLPEETRAAAVDLAAFVREGFLEQLGRARGGLRGLAAGSKLAAGCGMTLGSVVAVTSPQGELTPFGPRPSTFRFRVVAIFETGFYDIDNGYVFTTLRNAQDVLALGDVVSGLELKLDDPQYAPAVARAAEQAAGPKLGASHWMEQNRQLLNALRLEKTVSLITIGLIMLVAGLNILSVLVMSVLEKRRGIAVLMSLGARREQVARIFVLQGLLIAAAGTAIGLAAGYGLSLAAGRYRWIPLDEAIYSMSAVPFEPRPADALWIAAAALAVSFLATLYPARAAARTLPVETLRYE